jgi:hypothetical protein
MGQYVIALAFGLAISLGLYFIFFWPAREPPEDDGDRGEQP